MSTPLETPEPAPQSKKGGCMRTIGIALGIFVAAIIVIGVISGLAKKPMPDAASSAANPTESQTPNQENASLNTVAVAATSTPSPEETSSPLASDDSKKMGEEFKLGDFSYKIQKAFVVGGIKREFEDSLRPAEGAAFIIVEYSIRNDGNESDDMWASGFKIQDTKGRKFEPSSDVTSEIEMHSKRNDMFVKQLHPGITRQFKEGFEIPRDALSQPLVLVVPERGFFNAGEARVDLNITKLKKKPAARR